MNAVVKPISTDSEWTFDKIREYDAQIARVAKEFKLDTYPNQIEVITSEQMMDAYSSVGMPLNYNHWSFGKQFVQNDCSSAAAYLPGRHDKHCVMCVFGLCLPRLHDAQADAPGAAENVPALHARRNA